MVERRGELMHSVRCEGGMSAVIMDNLDVAHLSGLCAEFKVEVANDNSLSQVVLSGELEAINALTPVIEEAYKEKAVRVVPLKVSAPFHSRFMKDIEADYHQFISQFKESIDEQKLRSVVSNVTGDFYPEDKEAALRLLSSQLSAGVKWRDNMQAILSKTNKILELGPNRPLRGFFSTLGVSIQSIVNLKSAKKVFSE
jgi:malonyl CoA-acyl carrier protein transacylase